jgi:hypothetical protein
MPARCTRRVPCSNDEQYVQPAQEYGVDIEEVVRQDRLRLRFQERPPGLPGSLGGSMPASLRIRHTVDGARLVPQSD